MKTLFSALVLLSLFAGSARAEDKQTAIFQHHAGSFLTGMSLQISIAADGSISALRKERGEAKFEGEIARLSQQELSAALEGLALLKPGYKLRSLTPAEQRRLQGCASDSSHNYSVPMKEAEYGRLVVQQSAGCGLMRDLSDRVPAKARATVAALVKLVQAAFEANYDKIYK